MFNFSPFIDFTEIKIRVFKVNGRLMSRSAYFRIFPSPEVACACWIPMVKKSCIIKI